MSSWFSLMNVLVLVAGVAVGVVIGHFVSPAVGEAKRLRAELDRTAREHDTYKASVNAHFRKTADLVGQMTKSYAAVYDHLAGGARRFCDDAGTDSQVPFGPLPGALASPVIETAAESAGDTVEEAAGDEATAMETDSVSQTTTESESDTATESLSEANDAPDTYSDLVMGETPGGEDSPVVGDEQIDDRSRPA